MSKQRDESTNGGVDVSFTINIDKNDPEKAEERQTGVFERLRNRAIQEGNDSLARACAIAQESLDDSSEASR